MSCGRSPQSSRLMNRSTPTSSPPVSAPFALTMTREDRRPGGHCVSEVAWSHTALPHVPCGAVVCDRCAVRPRVEGSEAQVRCHVGEGTFEHSASRPTPPCLRGRTTPSVRGQARVRPAKSHCSTGRGRCHPAEWCRHPQREMDRVMLHRNPMGGLVVCDPVGPDYLDDPDREVAVEAGVRLVNVLLPPRAPPDRDRHGGRKRARRPRPPLTPACGTPHDPIQAPQTSTDFHERDLRPRAAMHRHHQPPARRSTPRPARHGRRPRRRRRPRRPNRP